MRNEGWRRRRNSWRGCHHEHSPTTCTILIIMSLAMSGGTADVQFLSRLLFLPSSSFLFNTHLIRARPSSNVVERRWIVPCAAFQSFGFLQTFLQHYFVRRRFLLFSFLPAFDSRKNSLVLSLVIMPCASCSRPPSKLLDDYLTTPVLSSSCWASQKGKATQGIGTAILTLRDEWHLNLSWLLHSRETHVV
jgi:hypothetical protein